MTKHLRFLFVMLLAMIWSAGWAQTTVFHETFDKCNNKGGNDNVWSVAELGNAEVNSTTVSDYLNNLWTNFTAAYASNKCVRLASNKKDGEMTTPTINSTGDFTIKIKAGACSGKSGVQLTVKTTAGTLDKSSVSLTAGKFNEYSIELSGVTKAFTLTFSIPSKKQSFIDDIEVINKASADTKKDPGISFGETTYTANITDKDDTYHSYVTLNNPNNLSVTYASSKTDVAEVNAAGEVTVLGLGTTTISATFAGDDTYQSATVSYELTVVDPNVLITTFTSGVDKGSNSSSASNGDEIIKNGVKISCSKTALGYDEDYRFYAGSSFTVSVETGTITKIEFLGKGDNKDGKQGLNHLEADGYTAANDKSGTWVGNAKNVKFSAPKIQARATSITVYVSLPSGITLDETEDNTIEAQTGVNVTLNRSMVANEWNTICLPFDVTMDKAKAAFGNDVKIVELDENATVDPNVLSFKASTGITAATPYLIKPSAVADEYTFENVDITNKAAEYSTTANVDVAFKGIYNMVDITKDVVEFGATYYAAFLGADNKIYKAKANGNKTKGFRAYFAIPKSASASALRVVIDGTATSIKNIDSEVVESNAPVYNLQGQRVNGNNLTPGIYVKAGKKFVVK